MNLSNYLINNKLINKQELENANQNAKINNISIAKYLAEKNILSPEDLANAISTLFQMPIKDISHLTCDDITLNVIPIEVILNLQIIPFNKTTNAINIAMIDPGDHHAIEIIKFQTGLDVHIQLVQYNQLQNLIQQLTTLHHTQSLFGIQENNKKEDHHELLLTNNNEPVNQFLNDTINNAVNKKASDIHFEVFEKNCRVRFRIDGLLHEITTYPTSISKQLVARLKIIAKLDIAECRIPQDGRYKIKPPNTQALDIRMSCCPTLYGEKIVLRLLQSGNNSKSINELGFTKKQKHDFIAAIEKPQGLIIVSGPTGSGKTVTLYAALQHLNNTEKNILTVEDPVEINLPGVNQVNVHLKSGLTFARTLRAFLRQDPDIIMIGEIRDLETAEIAIKAAQTGHLVLSTLHTNSAIEAITRLKNMGIAPYNLVGSLNLITAQRLARKLCPHCKEIDTANKSTFKKFQLSVDLPIYTAVGCNHCTQGYQGRIAIHEAITIDERFYDSILNNNSQLELTKEIQKQEIPILQQTGFEKIQNGLTSFQELQRVINLTLY